MAHIIDDARRYETEALEVASDRYLAAEEALRAYLESEAPNTVPCTSPAPSVVETDLDTLLADEDLDDYLVN
jgi:hypothetical protein